MYKILKQKTSQLAPKAVEFTQRLIRTPSPSGSEADVAKLVADEAREFGYDDVFTDDAGNVVALLLGREGSPTVMLNSHMDTVALEATDEWKHGPYAAQRDNGSIYGLGASDCKGGVAMQLYAGALLKRSLLPLRGNLIVAATVSEENGESAGLKVLLDDTLAELQLAPDYAILGEPTMLRPYYGHSGWTQIEIRLSGANPFQVKDTGGAVYDELRHAADDPSHGDGVQFMAVNAPRYSRTDGAELGVIRMERRMVGGASLANTLDGVRHQARLIANERGPVSVDVAVLEADHRLADGRVVHSERVANAWEIDPFHPLLERARRSLSAAGLYAAPGKWLLGKLGTGTGGGTLVTQYHIPTIGYGPGDEALAHEPDERVSEKMIADGIYGTAAIAHGLVGVPVYGWTSDEI